MKLSSEQDLTIGPYRGAAAEPYAQPPWCEQLADPLALMHSGTAEVLASERHGIVKVPVSAGGVDQVWLIKAFAQEHVFKNRIDVRRGSKARRTWLAACRLRDHGVGTPAPIAFLERWHGARLRESYFISRYEAGMSSLRDELVRLFHTDPQCERFLVLMQRVADAVRAMHTAGFLHNDLGNQNILMRRKGDADWGDVQFIDLNRGRVTAELTPRERGRDLSRIALPSDLLRVFHDMYWDDVPPEEFTRWEGVYRRRFAWHTRTRGWRHPLKKVERKARDAGRQNYPAPNDMWIWDERTGQPMIALRSPERRSYYSRTRAWHQLTATAKAFLPVRKAYRELRQRCFDGAVCMRHRVGVAIDPGPEDVARELALLDQLGQLPVLVRFYHHESGPRRRERGALVRQLAARGHPVALAIIQDRQAVLCPELWRAFVEDVLADLHDVVEWVEIGHAINRVKWGLWGFGEYRRLVAWMGETASRYPNLRWMGPAVIDFDYPHLLAALNCLPPGMRFQALSHLLYVDRRGAPENKQGAFDALDKFALARAIARCALQCEDRLIISEVNWPLQGHGVYSPVGSPYVSPGVRHNDPSVSEHAYADYMLRYLVMALCSGMVERVYWWRLVARGFGLVDDGDPAGWRERPAFRALRYFLATLGQGRFLRKLPGDPEAELYLFETPQGKQICMAYAPSGRCLLHLPFGYTGVVDAAGNALDGSVRKDAAITLSGSPRYFHAVSE